jgi:hypothetical protein
MKETTDPSNHESTLEPSQFFATRTLPNLLVIGRDVVHKHRTGIPFTQSLPVGYCYLAADEIEITGIFTVTPVAGHGFANIGPQNTKLSRGIHSEILWLHARVILVAPRSDCFSSHLIVVFAFQRPLWWRLYKFQGTPQIHASS